MALSLAWGGYQNGRIPLAELHAAPSFAPLESQYASSQYGSDLMRKDAAFQLSGLMRAFYEEFGVRLLLSEGYRPVSPVQDYYYNRYMHKLPGWTLAAFPGTSLHGWGLSADLRVEGVGNPSGKYLDWLRNNAADWGFVNDVPTEPWHWTLRTDLVTATIRVLEFILDQTLGVIPRNPSDTNTPVGEVMYTEIIHVDAKSRTGRAGSYDAFLMNMEEMKCMHIKTSTQEQFLLNKGVQFKTKEVQARSVLDSFEQVKGRGAAV